MCLELNGYSLTQKHFFLCDFPEIPAGHSKHVHPAGIYWLAIALLLCCTFAAIVTVIEASALAG
jgi:hypothetical protein